MTRIYGEPASGDPFTDRRRTGIGGSDAGAILGVSPYSSALAVWEEKRGLAPPRPVTPRMVWGTRLEGPILAGYAEDTGRAIRRGGRRFRRHPVHEFVIGHPDAEADDRIVESKATERLGDLFGEDGSADVPPHFYAQVQHYLILTGFDLADLVALVRGNSPHIYTIPADPDFQAALLDEEAALWERVKDDDPPEPDGSESAGAVLRRMFPDTRPDEMVATPEVNAYARDYLAARAARDTASAETERMAQLIQNAMGARSRLVGDGFSATWNDRKGSTSWKSVAAAYRTILLHPEKRAMPWEPDNLDAIELLHRGSSSRTFTFTVRRD